MSDAVLPALTVSSEPIDDPGPLLHLTEPGSPLSFVRRGAGLIGIGEALRLEFRGPTRLRDAAAAWRDLTERASTRDEVGERGSGLVAFGAFCFADASPAASVLIVPSMLVGRRRGRSWVTRVDTDAPLPRPSPWGSPLFCEFSPRGLDGRGYEAAVRRALDAITDGTVAKVVLARELAGRLPAAPDLRRVLDWLALAYPDTWTYAVDGALGSSPETLVAVSEGVARARVLAGSIRRGEDELSDAELAAALSTSVKDLDEHGYAVRSLLAALRPFSPSATASEAPFALKLPNLWHLASDIAGPVAPGVSSLDLLAALHPTAAVAGTPRAAALQLIAELEPDDRGRYAGPVGWVDASGDGEWAIALRGAQVHPDGTVVAHAGAGIVAESVPERELAETTLKFQPVLEAFS
ncbi:isochorismate synthase MenF [Lysobacter korlensis]|uniref:isochorismate synthase n=1 Tax=Lysobacter korlensis TaxID=553636 RepID=A0ABV6RVR7_9GAMM